MSGEQIRSEEGFDESKVCQACGFSRAREGAKFCQVCGQKLAEDYQPLDRLRASYNLKSPVKNQILNQPKSDLRGLFAENRNGASSTAIVFLVYSLVL